MCGENGKQHGGLISIFHELETESCMRIESKDKMQLKNLVTLCTGGDPII